MAVHRLLVLKNNKNTNNNKQISVTTGHSMINTRRIFSSLFPIMNAYIHTCTHTVFHMINSWRIFSSLLPMMNAYIHTHTHTCGIPWWIHGRSSSHYYPWLNECMHTHIHTVFHDEFIADLLVVLPGNDIQAGHHRGSYDGDSDSDRHGPWPWPRYGRHDSESDHSFCMTSSWVTWWRQWLR
jgi:hypothetical protein